MTFFDYLDVTFRLESKKLQTDGFTVFRDSKVKAVYWIIGAWRSVCKWINVPLVFLDYFAVQLGIHKPPVPPTADKPTIPQMDAPQANTPVIN